MRYHATLRRRGPYRARNGLVLGVCKGLADHFGISVFWTRMAAAAVILVSGLWPIVGLYLLAALLMEAEPAGWC